MIRAVLLDIEGTTSPVSYVYEVLFPYARARLRSFLSGNPQQGARIAAELAEEFHSDEEARKDLPGSLFKSLEQSLDDSVVYLEWLMDKDRKSTALKALQGYIWKEGFERGELRGELFPDVPVAIESWKDRGLKVAIFSSGSVLAQKQYFAHSNFGNQDAFIDANFDTETGPKRLPESYRRIAATLHLKPEQIVFISDVGEELDAARESGMEVRLALRPGNKPVEGRDRFQTISSFDSLRF